MNEDIKFEAERHKKFALLVSEFTFGLTHKDFLCDGVIYCFNSHEFSHLLIGYMGGVQTFPVRTHDGTTRNLNRKQLENLFAAAYMNVLKTRDEEFAANYKKWNDCKSVDDLQKFDPKQGWSYRSQALEAYENAKK